MTPGLAVGSLRRLELPAGLEQEWRDLAVAAEDPFASPGWARAWAHVMSEQSPHVLLCRRADGQLAGALPLVTTRRRRLVSPGAGLADWTAPACHPEDAEEVGAALGAHLARAGVPCAVGRVEPDADWWRACVRAAHGGGAVALTDGDPEPMPVVALGRDERGHLTALRGKQRREIARLRRRLEDAHDVRIARVEGARESRETMAALLALHQRAWGAEAGDDVQLAFLLEFAAEAQRAGWLRLWQVETGGRIVAVLYGLRLGARIFACVQAYDPALARFGVGTVLLRHAIESAAEEGAAVFDMLRGAEFHKRRYETSRRTVVPVVLTPPLSAGAAEVRLRGVARDAWRRLPAERRTKLRRHLPV